MRSSTRIMLITMLAVPVLSLAPGSAPPAHAVCQTTSLESALDRANSVFVGEVTALNDAGRTATMKVLEVWKGRDLPAKVLVEGEASDGSAQNHRTFQVGRNYLVESRDTRSPFESDRCTATKIYNPLGGRQIPANLAAAVGASQARPPLSTPDEDASAGQGGTSLLPFINGTLVLLAIVGAILMYRKVTRVESRKERDTAARKPAKSSKPGKSSTPGAVDPMGKMGRKLSFTGSIGRSGLESSRRLRGKKSKAVSTRALVGSRKAKKAPPRDDLSDS